jgi:signal recognition particle subunit SRP54
MFENLSERLTRTLRTVSGKARLTDDNIAEAMRDVRTALLEADVALSVVKDFIERIRLRALGQEVAQSLSPGQPW